MALQRIKEFRGLRPLSARSYYYAFGEWAKEVKGIDGARISVDMHSIEIRIGEVQSQGVILQGALDLRPRIGKK